MWLPRLLSVSSTVRVTRSSASMMVQGASKAIGQCQSSAAKPRRSHLKLLRCSLGWWVWGPEVVGGSFSPSKEKEDRGLISQGRSPIRVRAPNFMRIPMKRPPNRLCVSSMAVYFTWGQAGWVWKRSQWREMGGGPFYRIWVGKGKLRSKGVVLWRAGVGVTRSSVGKLLSQDESGKGISQGNDNS